MAREPYWQHVTIPPGVRQGVTPPHERYGVDVDHAGGVTGDRGWPANAGRLRSVNTGRRVVVCLAEAESPTTGRSNPAFTTVERSLGAHWDHSGWVDPDDVLAAVEARARPHTSRNCRGGVLAGDAMVQTHTNTPAAFLDDVAAARDYVDRRPTTREGFARSSNVVAALYWPTELGPFYLGYAYEPDDEGGSPEELLTFGFLRSAQAADVTPVRALFEALRLEPPRSPCEWPREELVLHGGPWGPPIDPFEVTTPAVGESRPALPLHGRNPVYGVPWERVVASGRRFVRVATPSPPPDDLWTPLERAHSLRYFTEGDRGLDVEPLRFDHLRALHPPTVDALWVTAAVEPVDRP
jgi:hypothetical protein